MNENGECRVQFKIDKVYNLYLLLDACRNVRRRFKGARRKTAFLSRIQKMTDKEVGRLIFDLDRLVDFAFVLHNVPLSIAATLESPEGNPNEGQK